MDGPQCSTEEARAWGRGGTDWELSWFMEVFILSGGPVWVWCRKFGWGGRGAHAGKVAVIRDYGSFF